MIDLFHGEYANTGSFHQFSFFRINLSYSDLHRMLRQNLGRKSKDLRELRRTISHDRGHRHSMHVSARRNFWCIEVGVSIEPDETDLLSGLAKTFSNSGDTSDSNRVIPAKHKRYPSVLPNSQDDTRQLRTGICDVFQVFR